MSNVFFSEKARKVINLFCQEIKNSALLDWHVSVYIYENVITIRVYRDYKELTRTLDISKDEIEIISLTPESLALFYLGQFKKSFEKEITYFHLNHNKDFNYSESFERYMKNEGVWPYTIGE